MAGKPCERVEGHDCGKTELPDVMECITADERTPGEANQCFDLHKDLLSQSSGRIATSRDGIKGPDVQPGRERHSHGGNRPR